jgi:hypothetical protein
MAAHLVQFKAPALEAELAQTHPEVQALVLDLAAWSGDEGLPAPCVTHVLRSRRWQRDTYTPYAHALLKRFRAREKLKPMELRDAQALATLDAAGIIAWAENRPSDHFWRCAVDLRNRDYTPAQLVRVMERIRTGRRTSRWQILSHDVGRGGHIHVGYRDPDWVRRFREPEQPAPEWLVERPELAQPTVRGFEPLPLPPGPKSA